MKDNKRILKLQEQLDLGLISEKDLSEEDLEKIYLLSDEQTFGNKKKTKNIKERNLKDNLKKFYK